MLNCSNKQRRIIEDATEICGRLDEKEMELHASNVVRNEYPTNMENFLRAIQLIQRKADQSRGVDYRRNLHLFKDLLQEVSLSIVHNFSHLYIDITRRWTRLKQDLLFEEETMENMKTVSETAEQLNISIDRWMRQTKDLIDHLISAKTDKNVRSIDSPRRNRYNRLVQTNQTPE